MKIFKKIIYLLLVIGAVAAGIWGILTLTKNNALRQAAATMQPLEPSYFKKVIRDVVRSKDIRNLAKKSEVKQLEQKVDALLSELPATTVEGVQTGVQQEEVTEKDVETPHFNKALRDVVRTSDIRNLAKKSEVKELEKKVDALISENSVEKKQPILEKAPTAPSLEKSVAAVHFNKVVRDVVRSKDIRNFAKKNEVKELDHKVASLQGSIRKELLALSQQLRAMKGVLKEGDEEARKRIKILEGEIIEQHHREQKIANLGHAEVAGSQGEKEKLAVAVKDLQHQVQVLRKALSEKSGAAVVAGALQADIEGIKEGLVAELQDLKQEMREEVAQVKAELSVVEQLKDQGPADTANVAVDKDLLKNEIVQDITKVVGNVRQEVKKNVETVAADLREELTKKAGETKATAARLRAEVDKKIADAKAVTSEVRQEVAEKIAATKASASDLHKEMDKKINNMIENFDIKLSKTQERLERTLAKYNRELDRRIDAVHSRLDKVATQQSRVVESAKKIKKSYVQERVRREIADEVIKQHLATE